MSSDIWLVILIVALVANAWCMVRFIQALRKFTKSQQQLNELIERFRS